MHIMMCVCIPNTHSDDDGDDDDDDEDGDSCTGIRVWDPNIWHRAGGTILDWREN